MCRSGFRIWITKPCFRVWRAISVSPLVIAKRFGHGVNQLPIYREAYSLTGLRGDTFAEYMERVLGGV